MAGAEGPRSDEEEEAEEKEEEEGRQASKQETISSRNGSECSSSKHQLSQAKAVRLLTCCPLRAMRQLHVAMYDGCSWAVSLTILWPAHRLTRALQITTTDRMMAAIRIDNAPRTQERYVAAAAVVLCSGYKMGGGTCECGGTSAQI
jgi:hypothetical protein